MYNHVLTDSGLAILKKILRKSMVELSVAEFEKDFDAYMDRIEAGENFLSDNQMARR